MAIRELRPLLLCVAGVIWAAPVGATSTLEAVHDQSGSARAPRPGIILVYDFEANPERVQVDLPTLDMLTGGSLAPSQRGAAGRRASAGLGQALFEALRRRGAPVQRARSDTPVSERALLVKGRFLSVDEGDPAARSFGGFGPGTVRVRLEFDAFQQRASAANLLWQGRVVTESAPGETTLIAQGALAEATGRMAGVAGGGVQAAAQRGRDVLTKYTAQTADTIAEALWVRFRSEGWLVDD
jgi:hypothetical protein